MEQNVLFWIATFACGFLFKVLYSRVSKAEEDLADILEKQHETREELTRGLDQYVQKSDLHSFKADMREDMTALRELIQNSFSALDNKIVSKDVCQNVATMTAQEAIDRHVRDCPLRLRRERE